MNVSQTLKDAWLEVQAAELPEELHAVAFREAVRLGSPYGGSGESQLSAATVARAYPAVADVAENSAESPMADEGEMYRLVVEQTGVSRSKLERLVHLDDDGPRISIAGIKLGKNTAERARAVAQLLTITRGFGLGEGDTSVEVIRKECERLKVYDSANFSTQLKALGGYVISGSGLNRRVRPRGLGVSGFSGFVDNLLDGE